MTGSELRELRKGARLTMQQLADKAGVSLSLIGFWESGRHPIPEKRIPVLRNILANAGVQSKLSPSELQSKTAKGGTKGPTCESNPQKAVRAMKAETIRPEVIASQREGDRYRGKTQAILGRGW